MPATAAGRLLGVDFGDERTGLAVCDDQGRIAVPLTIVERRGRSLDRVAQDVWIAGRNAGVEGMVVGLPLNMDGTEGQQAVKTRAFARRLATVSALPVVFADERLSSFIAEQSVRAAGTALRGRIRRLDDVAAAAILQSYLDRCRSAGTESEADQTP
jgi:putative Holliday junction resolvase